MPPDAASPEEAKEHGHLVRISVNNRAVEVMGPSTTGAAIKTAAIVAGLPIKPDFVLIEERPNGDDKTIGDDDPVTVNEHSKFTAVAPDDNS
ncbi:MAG TPA: multiubiquitin domain-containing protein [Vicinamibacterales bacterium]|nr:multiubiquitin domain-containing protein [Vicinamibacterales bacterium]